MGPAGGAPGGARWRRPDVGRFYARPPLTGEGGAPPGGAGGAPGGPRWRRPAGSPFLRDSASLQLQSTLILDFVPKVNVLIARFDQGNISKADKVHDGAGGIRGVQAISG